MADKLTIDVEKSALLAAFDRLPALILKHALRASGVTAHAIEAEAGRRIRRRTGETARHITVEVAHSGDGHVVFVPYAENPGLPEWIEFGTKYMVESPFLFNSARLEEGAHDRRLREAVQDAIDEGGLGG